MWIRSLPWLDGAAGLTAGLAVLALRGPLESFYGLSHDMLTFIGAANVAYALIGFTLGMRVVRPSWHLHLLIVANVAWTFVCTAIVVRVADTATPFGIAHVAGEGVFVLVLAAVEWRNRAKVLSPPAGAQLPARP